MTTDVEANRVYAAGLVIRDLPVLASNFRSHWTLSEYLQRENVVAIADNARRDQYEKLGTRPFIGRGAEQLA